MERTYPTEPMGNTYTFGFTGHAFDVAVATLNTSGAFCESFSDIRFHLFLMVMLWKCDNISDGEPLNCSTRIDPFGVILIFAIFK